MTQTVTHNNLGTGTVISMDEKNVTVDFNGTVKTLIIKFANLKNADGTTFGEQFVAKAKKVKKVNKANFMSDAEFAKSKYATMSNDDFEEERRKDRWATIGL